MKRLARLGGHLHLDSSCYDFPIRAASGPCTSASSPSFSTTSDTSLIHPAIEPDGRKLVHAAEQLMRALQERGIHDVQVSEPPPVLEREFRSVFTPEAVAFLAELARRFETDVDELWRRRVARLVELERGALPDFLPHTKHIREAEWRVAPVPSALWDRRVDAGDVVPCDAETLVKALNSGANGVQADFDDAHCPNWENTILGVYNCIEAVRGSLSYVTHATNGTPTVAGLATSPALLLPRPRAWNMRERHVTVAGRELAGPLCEFGLHMFHCAKTLLAQGRGPFLYLSKLENHLEARLWNDIFVWTEQRLTLPAGAIKACALIENILAAFEMDEILYELKDHSAGLNTGMWDYAASFIAKLGHRADSIFPDRAQYVSMAQPFMQHYRDLCFHTCHRRGALATGGMTPLAPRSYSVDTAGGPALPRRAQCVSTLSETQREESIARIVKGKTEEVQCGADGALVFDLALVPVLRRVFESQGVSRNQLTRPLHDVSHITARDLLSIPKGRVTWSSVVSNVAVGVLFFEAWLRGAGCFVLNGAIEDSATAEISRGQLWQWMRHQVPMTASESIVSLSAHSPSSSPPVVTRAVVRRVIAHFVATLCREATTIPFRDRSRILVAARLFEAVINMRHYPNYITNWLYDQDVFWTYSRLHATWL